MRKRKEAIIKILLVPEADKESNKQLSGQIKKSLTCDWLLKVEKINVVERHHEMPSGKEVEI